MLKVEKHKLNAQLSKYQDEFGQLLSSDDEEQ
jgi:hypothetical protein